MSSNWLDLNAVDLNFNCEGLVCPICVDVPHNAVLLKCSSYKKGCRPFLCDTDHTLSNCLDRFISAYGLSKENMQTTLPNSDGSLACPLCRGEVTGWLIIDEARLHLNRKGRCCAEKHCSYIGNYTELQIHVKLKHPHSRPSEVDPARKLDWENFQQSVEIVDVLSTIHAEVPHGVVLGDYVIEYDDEDFTDDYEIHGVRGKWWGSCIFYKMFTNFRASRNRRRSRARERNLNVSGSSSSTSPDVSTHEYNATVDGSTEARDDYDATWPRSPYRHYSYTRRQRSRLIGQ